MHMLFDIKYNKFLSAVICWPRAYSSCVFYLCGFSCSRVNMPFEGEEHEGSACFSVLT